MSKINRFKLLFKAFYQLSPSQLGLYALYQLGLRSGHYERVLTSSLKKLEELSSSTHITFQPCLPGLPDRNVLLDQIGSQIGQLYKEADEIISGNVHLFGGQSYPLTLTPPVLHLLKNWKSFPQACTLPSNHACLVYLIVMFFLTKLDPRSVSFTRKQMRLLAGMYTSLVVSHIH